MQFCRLYTGNDGKSHFEELDQAESSKHFLAPLAVKTLVFKNDKNRDDLSRMAHRSSPAVVHHPVRLC